MVRSRRSRRLRGGTPTTRKTIKGRSVPLRSPRLKKANIKFPKKGEFGWGVMDSKRKKKQKSKMSKTLKSK